MLDSWKNDRYHLPILADATYRCPCGYAADMDYFYGGPAYAHHMFYAIRCRRLGCERSEVGILDWKHTPAEAIVKWNRRCREESA